MQVGSRTYKRRFDVLVVSEAARQNRFWFETAPARRGKYISHVPYSGMVYDVTVPNHTVFVRRNGKPFWSSNCRFGSPPSELLQIMYENIDDIIWEGAGGKLVDPAPAGKWGAELILYSSWAEDNWQPVFFPENLTPNVSLRYCSFQKGRYAVRPQHAKLSHVGSVQAVGDTMDAAIAKCREYAEQVKGHGIECYPESLDKCAEQIKSMGAYKVRM